MGFWPDPTREAERFELVGGAVLLDARAQHIAIVIVGIDAIAVGVVKVGMADMPFAVVVRVVPSGSEPVAKRGYLTFT